MLLYVAFILFVGMLYYIFVQDAEPGSPESGCALICIIVFIAFAGGLIFTWGT